MTEVDGWRTRGSESFNPAGVVAHHTAGPRNGDMPSLNILINGRQDLPGPLCNVGLGRSGRVYVVAAGRANHAGSGGWRGLAGNSSVLGIEAENIGTSAEPWTTVMLDAYHRLAAALIDGTVPRNPGLVCGHKEWAPGRKVDPHTLNMNDFRTRVAGLLQGGDDVSVQDVLTGLDQYGGGLLARLDADTDRIAVIETKVDQILAAGGGMPGGGLSDADVGRIATKVADILAARLNA